MAKKQLQKISFDDFIIKQQEREKNKFKSVDIPVTVKGEGRLLTFVKCSESKILNMMSDVDQLKNLEENYDLSKTLIYECCPTLHDTKLHEALGIKDCYDIVTELFEMQEVFTIAEQLLDLIGLGDVKKK